MFKMVQRITEFIKNRPHNVTEHLKIEITLVQTDLNSHRDYDYDVIHSICSVKHEFVAVSGWLWLCVYH